MAAGFHCLRCGNCCRIPGAVHLSDEESAAIADFLGISIYAFTEKYTRISASRGFLELADKDDGSCIMLDKEGHCRINEVKPQQCKDFPFTWRNADSASICPAIKTSDQTAY